MAMKATARELFERASSSEIAALFAVPPIPSALPLPSPILQTPWPAHLGIVSRTEPQPKPETGQKPNATHPKKAAGLTFWPSVGIGAGAGAVVALLVQFLLVPYVREKIRDPAKLGIHSVSASGRGEYSARLRRIQCENSPFLHRRSSCGLASNRSTRFEFSTPYPIRSLSLRSPIRTTLISLVRLPPLTGPRVSPGILRQGETQPERHGGLAAPPIWPIGQ